MSEKIFPDGLYFNLPNDKAPDFIWGSVSMEIPDFLAFLSKSGLTQKANFDLKVSKGGKGYMELNTWKPERPEFLKKEEPKVEDATKDISAEDIDFGSSPF